MTPTTTKKSTAARRTEAGEAERGFTEAERGAMKERAKELKASRSRKSAGKSADEEADVLAKIAEMDDSDRGLAERIHAIATSAGLTPRLWYGMPAYANEDGKVLCFFQPARKFKSRYATLGFSDEANLDDGAFWPVYFALTKLTKADEAKIGRLVKQASS